MDFLEKVGGALTGAGREVADKAKVLAEVGKLKGQIASCEEVIRKNYLEIGRLYCEQEPCGEDPFAKQRQAVENARQGIRELEQRINEVKGL